MSGIRFAVKRATALHVDSSKERTDTIKRSLQRELNVLRTVHHPNMVRLIGFSLTEDSELDSNNICIVHELGTRGSVDVVLEDDALASGFTWRHRVRAFASVASCLNYLHRAHTPPIFHRDVKCANIVLGDAWQAKLIDCGAATVLTEEQAGRFQNGQSLLTLGLTTTGAGQDGGIIGTHGYLCPRYMMSRGQKFGPRTEIFAFGITMLEMLIGQPDRCVPKGIYHHYIDCDAADDDSDSDSSDSTAPTENTNDQDRVSGGGASKGINPAMLDKRAGQWPAELAVQLIDLAKSCVAEYRDRPKNMRSILHKLKDLRKKYCAATVEEAYMRVAALEALNSDVVEAQRAALLQEQREKDAAAAAQEEAERAARRECITCFDKVPMHKGVICTAASSSQDCSEDGGDGERGDGSGCDGHFMCDECFEMHVMTESGKSLHDLQRRKGHVYCAAWGCENGCPSETPFADSVVASHVPKEVFEMFLQARNLLTEKELAITYEARLQIERERILAMTAEQLQVSACPTIVLPACVPSICSLTYSIRAKLELCHPSSSCLVLGVEAFILMSRNPFV